MKITKAAVLLMCAALAVTSAAGCSKSGGGDTTLSSTATDSTAKKTSGVKLKEYKFPESLKDLGAADVLSHVVYKSFNAAESMTEPETQPFADYDCTSVFAGSYYVFVSGENFGLLSSDGTELIEPENVKKISAAAENLLQVRYDDGTTEYYRTAPDGTGVTLEDLAQFDRTRISFEPTDEPELNVQHSVLCMDGVPIYDTKWLGFETVLPDALDTSKDHELVYKVVSTTGNSYYIVFDKFYNFSIYEAEYGFVSFKIDGEYRECYILGHEDHEDLETLISSFGSESRSAPASSDEDRDYIQVTLGLGTDSETKYTFSPDGYCLVEKNTDQAGGSKYFTAMDPETFTDLVSWLDSSLSEEYTDQGAMQ